MLSLENKSENESLDFILLSLGGEAATYTYDTLGNLVLEKAKNKVVDYQYDELNRLEMKYQ